MLYFTDIIFNGCKGNVTIGILSLMEIIGQLQNISFQLAVAPNLMFFNKEKQDTLLVLDNNGMQGLINIVFMCKYNCN